MSRLFVYRKGGVREEPIGAFAEVAPSADFLWLHLDGTSDDVAAILARITAMPDPAITAFRAQETRPRCAQFSDGALVNLRGLGAQPDDDGDSLVSIRIWVQRGLAVTLSYRSLGVFDRLVEHMLAGQMADPGDLVAATAMEITDALDPHVAELGDGLDEVECRVLEAGKGGSRHKVAELRSDAINYRRFLAPQRQAMERLMTAQVGWLEPDDRLHLQEAADRCARMVEELEAMRERAALVHEALTDLRAEHMNRQALILAIVALVFLPLTFVTGLLGMNVAGIPFSQESWAFWGVSLFCLAVGGGMAFWFKATHWLQK